jgi:hypothetical protein
MWAARDLQPRISLSGDKDAGSMAQQPGFSFSTQSVLEAVNPIFPGDQRRVLPA